jgi:hypothetical protein
MAASVPGDTLHSALLLALSKDLPRVVQITAGQATRLDLSIDTGIR